MAHAVQVLNHRNARFAHQPLDQTLAAARHDHIHVFLHGDEFAHGSAIRRFNHLNHRLRQTSRCETFAHTGGNRLIGMQRFRAAAQNRRVAGFQAQPGGICRHVRARFINDAHHAQRHAHLPDLDARWAIFQPADFTDRIGQFGDLHQAVRHCRNGFGREDQPINCRIVEFFVTRLGDIARVGVEQHWRRALDGLRGDRQRRVFCGRGCLGDQPRRGACLPAHALHVSVYVHDGILPLLTRGSRAVALA